VSLPAFGTLSPLETLIRARVSLRRYAEKAVPDDVILSVVDAARRAPSASNGQPWRFIAVTDRPAREALARACFTGLFSATRFAAKAPLIVALCAERAAFSSAAHAVKDRKMYQLDCGIAGEHLVLRAAELGLGTCWIAWFPRRRAHRVLGAPPREGGVPDRDRLPAAGLDAARAPAAEAFGDPVA
jgi:nitroreductase